MPVFVGAGTSSFMKGSDGVGVSTMTTTERNALSGVKAGQFIYNQTTNLMEYYNGTAWKPIDSSPLLNNFSIDGGPNINAGVIDNTAGGNATIVINGQFFDTTAGTVTFISEAGGTNVNVQSITRTSQTQFTVTVQRSDFTEANDPYTLSLENGSGLAATIASAIDVNRPPAWSTAADTNIGTVQDGDGSTEFGALTSVAATDPEGDTITHTISAGSLPNGMSLAAAGTFTGTVSGMPSSETEYTFTVQAATTHYTVTRQFKISGIDSIFPVASGGSVNTSGDYKIHTFNSSSNFVVSKPGANPNNQVRYLIVGGGGGGGNSQGLNEGNHTSGGGGGAGGMRFNNTYDYTITGQTYPITVGSGGVGGSSSSTRGSNGNSSSFGGLTSAGGGTGGDAHNNQNGNPGGSGGGAGVDFDNPTPTIGSGGSGNSPSTSPSQGNPGGSSRQNQQSGGGGGAGQSGQPGDNNNDGPGGDGGNGLQNDISGNNTFYAGGGGGGAYNNSSSNAGSGGNGGGGNAGHQGAGQPGTSNTGGGGGGINQANGTGAAGGTGGSGIVIIRYKYQ